MQKGLGTADDGTRTIGSPGTGRRPRRGALPAVIGDVPGNVPGDAPGSRPIRELPGAQRCGSEIAARLAGKRAAIFLDYDGTLAAIAEHPDLALLDPETRAVMRDLADRCFVAVVSGRDVDDVRAKIGLDALVYVGSHGFDIESPDGRAGPDRGDADHRAALDAAEAALGERLGTLPGLLLERKRFSLAVHTRQVAEAREDAVADAVAAVLAEQPGLTGVRGKKVFELRPAVDWHKGKAVLWLLQFLGAEAQEVLPIYIGDDITDEDAFQALQGRGLGIVVGDGISADSSRASFAGYALAGPPQVRAFLEFLVALQRGLDAADAAARLETCG